MSCRSELLRLCGSRHSALHAHLSPVPRLNMLNRIRRSLPRKPARPARSQLAAGPRRERRKIENPRGHDRSTRRYRHRRPFGLPKADQDPGSAPGIRLTIRNRSSKSKAAFGAVPAKGSCFGPYLKTPLSNPLPKKYPPRDQASLATYSAFPDDFSIFLLLSFCFCTVTETATSKALCMPINSSAISAAAVQYSASCTLYQMRNAMATSAA